VSSSGHIALVPSLLGWSYRELGPDVRKAFEVALHAGTAAALSLALRDEVLEVVRDLRPERVLGASLAFLPPALAAAAWERPIEERLGSPRSVARAQVVAGVLLGLADRRPADRPLASAGALDHLLVGLGQAAALAPGVSRGGASLTALRLRRLERPAAHRLSRHAALPIILAAAGLKGARLARTGLPPGLRAPFAVGTLAAFASTALGARLIPRMDRARSYAPFALYRVALGALALARERRSLRSGT
jgi:undecaprenyl-diphosphatase